MEMFWFILFWGSAVALAYMLVGYSAVLLLVGRVTPGRVRGQCEPMVSLIIPAHNEESVLQEKLENSLAIDYPSEKLEILVASDGSIDRTAEIAASFADQGVQLLDMQPRRGKASVLNDAAAAAQGDLLFMCDANVMFAPKALKNLAGWFTDEQVGAATGVVELASEESNFGHGESFYYQLERAIQVAESRIGSMMGVDGGMYVMRKSLFRPIPADSLLDDFAISMQVLRQGRRIVFDPDAHANECGTPKAIQEFRRRVRMAAGVVQVLARGHFPSPRNPILFWQFLSHKLVRWLGPVWLPALLVANWMLWSQGWFYQFCLVAQLLTYAVAGIGALSVRLRDRRWIAIPFYFVLSQVAMAVGLVRGVFRLQKVTWAQAERAQAR